MKSYTIDFEETITPEIDWSDLLTGLGGVTIASSEWEVPDALTIVVAGSNTSTTAKIKLAPAEAIAGRYTVYNKITTSGDDTRRRAILIQVRDAATFNEPSDLEESLEAVRAVMTNTATKNQKSYTINNRQLQRYDMTELLALESRLTTLVRESRMANALRNGAPFLKNVQTRFR